MMSKAECVTTSCDDDTLIPNFSQKMSNICSSFSKQVAWRSWPLWRHISGDLPFRQTNAFIYSSKPKVRTNECELQWSTVLPNVRLKSCQISPKICPNSSHSYFLLQKWCFTNYAKKLLTIWATFVIKFAAKNYKNHPIWSHWWSNTNNKLLPHTKTIYLNKTLLLLSWCKHDSEKLFYIFNYLYTFLLVAPLIILNFVPIFIDEHNY